MTTEPSGLSALLEVALATAIQNAVKPFETRIHELEHQLATLQDLRAELEHKLRSLDEQIETAIENQISNMTVLLKLFGDKYDIRRSN